MSIKAQIEEVKRAKAVNRWIEAVKVYGGVRQALRALDSIDQEEAIETISIGVKVSIFKRDGKVIVQ